MLTNLGNILFGSATPHNCYGTSGTTPGCGKQWFNIPESNAKKIEPNPNYKTPIVIPQYQINEDQFSQILKDTNNDMKKLLPSTKGTK